MLLSIYLIRFLSLLSFFAQIGRVVYSREGNGGSFGHWRLEYLLFFNFVIRSSFSFQYLLILRHVCVNILSLHFLLMFLFSRDVFIYSIDFEILILILPSSTPSHHPFIPPYYLSTYSMTTFMTNSPFRAL